ncbi:MAG: response regulator receiver [Gammaproteobacteria bacterium]|nr:MAG: response regulator receiver [Gammaproteobacteria bacterium]TND02303.1 MAG: response regulator receiver protein [Gammaproteobacteria bacterium]
MLDKNATILVVDDAMIMREGLRRVLATLGYTNVLQAENGREAMKILENPANQVRLMFLDIVMPIMDGKATLKKIRETDQKLPVVMLTSVADKDSIVECSKQGITSYVLKPINAETGPDIVSKLLAKLV